LLLIRFGLFSTLFEAVQTASLLRRRQIDDDVALGEARTNEAFPKEPTIEMPTEATELVSLLLADSTMVCSAHYLKRGA
jgi:hypothetical protein